MLEDSGISPHHPVQIKLKCSFQGLVTRVQADPESPAVVRENLAAGTSISRRAWTNDGRSSCRALSKKSWEDAISWETRHEPARAEEARQDGSSGRWSPRSRTIGPGMAKDTRWWRVLSNRLRELWLMEALPTRRPHLAQQPEQMERLCTHLRRMANEARAEKDRAEIWEMATQEYGEPELQTRKDVHWRALTVLDKLHKRDRRVREKSIAEYAREASQGRSGLLASPHEAESSLVPQRRGAR